MRKRLISICIVGIMLCGIYKYVRSEEISPMAESIEDIEGVKAEDDESAEPIYIIEPWLTQDDTYEMQDWQAAYAEYIEGLEWNRDCTYSLIYVDDDDIPELVIDTGNEAGGCEILTFHNGEIDVLQTMRLHFYYIEKKNLVNNFGGKMGYYFDRIYSIENGKWVHVADGEWTETMGDEDLIYQYKWDGEEVEEDVYKQSLNAVFDMEQKIEPNLYYIMDEMLALFQTGDVASQSHRYELYIEDVTWDGARSRCEERGGYLATITSPEEYERIQKGIVDSRQTDIAFWVGASDNEEVLGQKIFGFGWLEPDKALDDYCMLDHFDALFIFWEPNEPSYEVEVEGKTIKEDFAYFMYDDTEERCYLYDAPMDMLSVWPEYTGKIGYICEYEPVTVMAKETWFYPDDDSRWYEYEYDDAGNQTKESYYTNGSLVYWYEYGYDSTGNNVKDTMYNDDGSVRYIHEFEYDSRGNKTKKTTTYYPEDGRDTEYEWEYDNMGNLTRSKYVEYWRGEL